MRNKRTWTPLIIVVAILVSFNAGYVLAQSPWAPFDTFGPGGRSRSASDNVTQPFWEVWDMVQERYYEQPVDQAAMIEGAISGMLETLGDQHTRYLPPTEEQASQQQMDGEFQGIGVVVEDIDGRITVVSPIEGSPAEAAGLQPGDVLLEADGQDLVGMGLAQAADLIRGPAGTTVSLVIEREAERLAFEIVRDVIKVPSVRGEMLENGIGYIRITNFIRATSDELETVLGEIMAAEPHGLVLDLRRNPGGLLDQVVAVADEFLGEGLLMSEEFGSGDIRVYETGQRGTAEDIPMVVLVDEGSASAAELLAGAIQDRGRGPLIGTKTFGKGTVQAVETLSNGGGLRLTIARWLTPAERWINADGLEPDYVVVFPEFEEVEGEGEAADVQLDAAVSILLGEPVVGLEQPATPMP